MCCAPLCPERFIPPDIRSAPIAFSTELYGHVATADAEVHRCTAKADTKSRGRSASADRAGKELHNAAAEEDEVKVRGLLGRGASIEWRDETGLTALHMAATRGHVRVARLLLQAGADVDAECSFEIVSLQQKKPPFHVLACCVALICAVRGRGSCSQTRCCRPPDMCTPTATMCVVFSCTPCATCSAETCGTVRAQ